jgi:tetratricopeptide (TPR) repeat protein
MLRGCRLVLRFPSIAWGACRRRPLVALALLFTVAAGTAAGVWLYAKHQWDAARLALKQDRAAEARERLGICLAVWPRSPEVHLLAARAARLTSDLDAADGHLKRCLQLQGGASEAVQLEFLLMRVQTGEIDELVPTLLDTVERGHPEAPIILETLAGAYILRLRYKPAYACLSRWIELEPENAKPYHWRGWVLERLNNPKPATEDYHKALELDPDLIPVRLRVAEMLLENKQAPDALPHLERLYRQVPNDPQVQARLGTCRLFQGRTAEARQLLEAAVVHLPRDPALLVDLARLDMQEGRVVEAERWLRQVLEFDSSDTEALYVLASALQHQGRAEESAEVMADYERKRGLVERINEMLKDVADSPTARADDYAELGSLFLQIGRDKFGVYWSERALERDPVNQQAHRALAEYYERTGDAAKAAVHRRSLREPAATVSGPAGR